jgi:hypothetical protein
MKKKKGMLYYLYYALGQKSHPHCNKTADRVALIRLLITLQILITNFFIIYGVIRVNHFPIDKQQKVEVVIDGSVLPEYQPPPRRALNKPLEFE